jgi:hypothetical protein
MKDRARIWHTFRDRSVVPRGLSKSAKSRLEFLQVGRGKWKTCENFRGIPPPNEG